MSPALVGVQVRFEGCALGRFFGAPGRARGRRGVGWPARCDDLGCSLFV